VACTFLRADGAPAAGAKVALRIFGESQSGGPMFPGGLAKLHSETAYTADAAGKVTVTLPSLPKRGMNGPQECLLIEAPGCAVTMIPLSSLPGLAANPIKLLPGKTFAVRLTDPQGQPLPGAQVALCRDVMTNYPLNMASLGVATPSLVATADAQGVARLPLVATRVDVVPTMQTHAVAVGKRGAEYFCVSGSVTVSQQAADTGAVQELTLQPARTVGGRVSAAGRAVAGAIVTLSGDTPMPAAVSDAQGRYLLICPATTTAQLTVLHPDFTEALTPIRGATTDVVLTPLLTVTGRVVDAATGQTPAGPLTVVLSYGRNPDGTGRDTATLFVPVAADGTFTVRPPAALCTLFVRAAGYNGAPHAITKQFANGEQVVLKVDKAPGAGGRAGGGGR